METSLTWIALAIGALGAVLAMLFARRGERTENGRAGLIIAGFAVVITVIIFLLTRPVEDPFSAGQRLGYGALIGGLLGVLAGLWPARSAAGYVSPALVGIAAILLIFPGYPQPALAGFMIGAVAAGLLFRLALGAIGMEIWSLAAVATAATITLGVIRFDNTPDRFWWRAPLMVLAAVVIAQFVASALARENRKASLPAAISAFVTLALIAVFAWKVFPDWSVLLIAVAGVLTFALVAWIASTAASSVRAAAVAAVAVIALTTFAFRQLGGFGMGLALLAGWAVVLPFVAASRNSTSEEHTDAARPLVYAMLIGVGALLLRLFLENYSVGLAGLDLHSHYTFVTLSLGIVFPFVLISYFPIFPDRGPVWRGVGAAAAGMFAAIAPLVIAMVWGMKPALGFVMGTVGAEVLIFFLCLKAMDIGEQGFLESGMLALTAQISAVLLSGVVLPLSESPRVTRILVLAAVLLAAATWGAVRSVLARGRAREV